MNRVLEMTFFGLAGLGALVLIFGFYIVVSEFWPKRK